MIILFTLWYVLGWQFPTWLWVLSGLFYLVSLRSREKNNKKVVRARTHILPFYLASAIIFGTDIAGQSILPPDKSFWTIIGILVGAFVIRLIISRPDKIIKKEMAKSKKRKESSDGDINVSVGDDDDDELRLHVKIKNKEKNKTSNVKINLENSFIKEKFIQKIVLKSVKKGWQSRAEFQDDSGNLLFDIEDIYRKAKENPVRGEILTIDNEKVMVSISIK